MGCDNRHVNRTMSLSAATLTVAAAGATVLAFCAPARADEVAYLVNVTARPGYNFANADQALAYGHGLCQKVADGEKYAQILGDVKSDFGTVDEYQASYLVSQSAQELCPDLIWQLRNSAANYQPSQPPAPMFPQCASGMEYWPAC